MTNHHTLVTMTLLCVTALFAGCRSGTSGTVSQVSEHSQLPLEFVDPAVASVQTPVLTLASYQEKPSQNTTETTSETASDAKSKAKADPKDSLKDKAELPKPLKLEPVVVEALESPADDVFRLTLSQAINIALTSNPDLIAVRSSEPVARGALGVAQTYIFNPQFQTQVLPYSRDRNGNDGAVAQQHVVVQTFELGGQQQYREGVAVATLGQVSSTVNQAELMAMALTSRLYFTAVYQREIRDLNQTLSDLNEKQIGVIERREKAGQANAADVALAKLQAQASRRQQRLAEANYRTALLALRTQLNLDQETPLDLSIGWQSTNWQEVDEGHSGNGQHSQYDRTRGRSRERVLRLVNRYDRSGTVCIGPTIANSKLAASHGHNAGPATYLLGIPSAGHQSDQRHSASDRPLGIGSLRHLPALP